MNQLNVKFDVVFPEFFVAMRTADFGMSFFDVFVQLLGTLIAFEAMPFGAFKWEHDFMNGFHMSLKIVLPRESFAALIAS